MGVKNVKDNIYISLQIKRGVLIKTTKNMLYKSLIIY